MPADGLSVLGLGPAEQAAYELLVDHPSATLASLSPLWTSPEPLEIMLACLEERALAVSVAGPPTRYHVVAPGVAFDALLVRHEDELERARRHADLLAATYQARPVVRDTATVIEVVTGTRSVRQRLLRLQNGARTQIGYLTTLFGVDHGPPRPGLTCRAIYDRSAIEHPGALATVERLINAGQQARVLPGLPLSLYLIDDKVAALPSQRPPAPVDTIIVVHPSALLDALVALFETLWQRALPLHPPPHNRSGPGATSQRLITLLLSGLTDEAIARQLGLSHRTVQRHVATLMADLNAHTRFQAGAQSALFRLRRPPNP